MKCEGLAKPCALRQCKRDRSPLLLVPQLSDNPTVFRPEAGLNEGSLPRMPHIEVSLCLSGVKDGQTTLYHAQRQVEERLGPYAENCGSGGLDHGVGP